MMWRMKNIIFLFFLSSCSLFKTHYLAGDLRQAVKKVCLNTAGKGRLFIKERKYIFSYESALDEKHANWILALSFPMHKTETFKIDWSEEGRVRFESSIEEKILKENSEINPQSLEVFTHGVGKLLNEVIELKTQRQTQRTDFKWKVSRKNIVAVSRKMRMTAKFSNLVSNSHFGLISVSYHDLNDQTYKMDLVVKNCFK